MSIVPERYVIFDTESASEWVPGDIPTQRLTLRLGSALAVDSRESRGKRATWHDFGTEPEFHDFLSGLQFTTAPIYVFAHNIGFDVRQVNWWWWVGQGRYTLTHPGKSRETKASARTVYITDSPPFIVVLYRPDGQKLILLDTLQWLSASLDQIGRWIGEPKGKMPHQDASDDDWLEYCRQDVRVLWKALKRLWAFLDAHRVPRWTWTLAMQSMQLYSGREGKGLITRPEDPDVLKLDRHGYYGGLAEGFRIGTVKGPLYQLDVSSLYPSVMIGDGYPVEVLEMGDYSQKCRVPDDFQPWEMTAEVYLESPDQPWPVRGSDQTLWVRGRVRTVLCGPELTRAYCSGVIKRVGRWVRHRMGSPFTEFVRLWWDERLRMRAAGRTLEESVCKGLLNSLHGKFGQREHDWTDTGIFSEPGKYGAGVNVTKDATVHSYWRIIAGHEFVSGPEREHPRGFVPLAAWTASYGRCAMWDAIHTAGADHVFYIATDSLIVDGEGLGQLQLADMVEPGVLGKFRVEGTVDGATIYGANAIDWGARKIRPGVKSDAVEVMPDLWCVHKWSGFEEDIRKGRLDSVTIEAWFIQSALRSNRRQVAADGTTRAWEIDNWRLLPEAQSRVPVRG